MPAWLIEILLGIVSKLPATAVKALFQFGLSLLVKKIGAFPAMQHAMKTMEKVTPITPDPNPPLSHTNNPNPEII
jgi:hypothetical protein